MWVKQKKHLKTKTRKMCNCIFFLLFFCFRFQVGQNFCTAVPAQLIPSPTPQNEFPPRLKPHEREIGPGYCFLNAVHLGGHFCWGPSPTVGLSDPPRGRWCYLHTLDLAITPLEWGSGAVGGCFAMDFLGDFLLLMIKNNHPKKC